uniref:Arylacetamide deacetylase like 4 n=1 Tax=Balaenoptera musculus TaxID=9771 RepID=A0A8C0CRP3_BALMU
MVAPWLVLLAALCTFLLGVFVWAVFEHFLTTGVPSTLQNPAKFRFLHCVFLYMVTLKLGICSMPRFIQFLHNSVRIKKDPGLVVTDLLFGTAPVRLFQPKAASPGPPRGIIFFHGGEAVLGSLDMYRALCAFLSQETDSVLLSVGKLLEEISLATVWFCRAFTPVVDGQERVQGGMGISASFWQVCVVICGHSAGAGIVTLTSQTLVGRSGLPRIRAQVLIYPIVQLINFRLPSFPQNQHVQFLTRNGAFIPPEVWKKYWKWVSADNIPERFKKTDWTDYQPVFPGPFNEAAYLENNPLLDVKHTRLIKDDETIAQLPEAFLVSCEYDILRDDIFLCKKCLEDQGVPVTWYHVEDGFHGSLILFDRKPFSFPCSLKIVNALVSYIKSTL